MRGPNFVEGVSGLALTGTSAGPFHGMHFKAGISLALGKPK